VETAPVENFKMNIEISSKTMFLITKYSSVFKSRMSPKQPQDLGDSNAETPTNVNTKSTTEERNEPSGKYFLPTNNMAPIRSSKKHKATIKTLEIDISSDDTCDRNSVARSDEIIFSMPLDKNTAPSAIREARCNFAIS